jgi:hypothetical protein
VVIQNEKYLMVDKTLATILFFKVLQLLQQLKVYLHPLVLQSFLFFSLLPLLSLQERYTLFLYFLTDPLTIFLHGLTLALLHLFPLLLVLNLLSTPFFSLIIKAHVPF